VQQRTPDKLATTTARLFYVIFVAGFESLSVTESTQFENFMMKPFAQALLAEFRRRIVFYGIGMIIVGLSVWLLLPRGNNPPPLIPPRDAMVAVANTTNDDRRCDIVFVHGLGGDSQSTWENPDSKFYWPKEIGKELPNAGIWAVNYDAQISEWLGDTMPLQDRSKNLLQSLKLKNIGERPVIFIAHSLGGILVKQMLRDAKTGGTGEWNELADNCKGVVFLATPNSGSDMSDYLGYLGKVLPVRETQTKVDLEKNSPLLRDLNIWYRNNVAEMEVKTTVFYEQHRIKGFLVVDQSSADPGVAGITPLAVDEDHSGICKPYARRGIVYDTVLKFIDDEVVPLPTKCKMTLREYITEFNTTRASPAMHVEFVRQHKGQQIEWEAKVYSVNNSTKPSIVIVDTESANDNDAILASFYPSQFKQTKIGIGQRLKLRAVIKTIASNGTILSQTKVLEKQD